MKLSEHIELLLKNEKKDWEYEFWNETPSYDDHGQYFERGRIDALEEVIELLKKLE